MSRPANPRVVALASTLVAQGFTYREVASAALRIRYRERRAAGQCVECPSAAIPERTRCSRCLDRLAVQQRARKSRAKERP